MFVYKCRALHTGTKISLRFLGAFSLMAGDLSYDCSPHCGTPAVPGIEHQVIGTVDGCFGAGCSCCRYDAIFDPRVMELVQFRISVSHAQLRARCMLFSGWRSVQGGRFCVSWTACGRCIHGCWTLTPGISRFEQAESPAVLRTIQRFWNSRFASTHELWVRQNRWNNAQELGAVPPRVCRQRDNHR